MNAVEERAPHLALIDDDSHSAWLMARALEAAGAPRIVWLGGAEDGRIRLVAQLTGHPAARPGLLLVDLKARSTATGDFVAAIAPLLAESGIAIVAMAQDETVRERERLLAAGADAVFVRHRDRDAYRREAAAVVDFWARGRGIGVV